MLSVHKTKENRMESKRKIPVLAIIIIIIFVILGLREFYSGLREIYVQSNSKKYETKNTESGNNPYNENSYLSIPRDWDDYKVVVEDNLFLPLGWEKNAVKEFVRKPEPKTETVETPQERPQPTYSLTLTGIAQNGSDWLAVFEDINREEGYFLHRGEKLKDSIVSEVFPEYIVLAQGNTKAELPLGTSIQYDTNGQVLLDTVNNSQYSVREVQKSDEEDDKLQSLIERMRTRRRKELEEE